ncbi:MULTISPECIES: hypothetical protein [Gammaproteobacteria]|uniref:Uncharacterized protein n=1 Tax=Ferrimonas sediminicola TaxID=2569538 RepID=A0A4U1BJ90_9GAMM|nr:MULTISPECIES: hypothetical protein [Gammaproteobacteria]EGQ8024446.1 hypothetical protein [Vibrio vulnificus]RZQ76301.1 hypothetical protein D8T30_06105 [Vibrio vulnificus]RZR01897.1 hypothetical protein D8T29_05975 [Vibrio vulnificus]RZR44618.1 hypothetical protein D8T35_21130 [Vibrio vulnificus]TKB50609.1 hypothetical protein FCL40_05515 [Ferrimonas sediminicola]
MKDIYFKIYHPTLDLVSDRTFRSILKKFSSVIREIQYQEVMVLVNQSDLSPSEKQSIRDKLKGKLNHIDAYYIEKIERGSITITGLVTTAALGLLAVTVGESVKEAWKKSEFHKSLVEYLTMDLTREKQIERNVDRVFEAWNFDGFVLESVEKEQMPDGSIEIAININTDPWLSKHIEDNLTRDDVDTLLAQLNDEIKKLEKNA